MNELIVGFDASEESELALRWAGSVAAAARSALVVLEAWSGGDPAAAVETGERVRKELARAAGAVLAGVDAGVDVSFESRQGGAVAAFLERVTSDSGLVLGSRGRGGFAGLLLGSVSRECIEHAPGPVMIVRQERLPPLAGTTILVGHDGSSSASSALQWAVTLAGATGAQVVAAHVWQTGSSEVRPHLHERLSADAARSVEGWAAEVGPAVGAVHSEGDPRSELVRFAEQLDAALLVVGRRGAGGVRALRIGSVVSYLVTASPVPIAVVPPPPGAGDT